MAVEIDWQKLKKAEDGSRLVFEHFCCQLFLRCFQEYGIPEAHYNMAGSEAYITLQKSLEYNGISFNIGDVIGIQAKFWVGERDEEHSPINIPVLEDGFDQTISHKQNIKLWIISTPGKFSEGKWDELVGKLTLKKSDCHFAHWHKETYQSFYLDRSKKYNGIFLYYFDGLFIDDHILESTTRNTLTALEEKYDVDLHTPSRLEKVLLSIIDRDNANVQLHGKVKSVVEAVREDAKRDNCKIRERLIAAKLPESFIDLCEQEIAHRCAFAETLAKYIDEETIVDKAEEIESLVKGYREGRKAIVEKLNQNIQHIQEDASTRNDLRIIDWHLREIVERVNQLEELISAPTPNGYNLVQILHLITQRVHSIFAEPGMGKTHFACSIANSLLRRKTPRPVLLLQGTRFKEGEIEDVFGKVLKMTHYTTLDDIMDVLDFIGESNNCQFPIIIDGLNETQSGESRWLTDLPVLQRHVQVRDHMMLITTCRSQKDYLQTIYGKDSVSGIKNSYELSGIEPYQVEETAKKYFKKYQIVPNPNPDLTEFTNPLLLKIFCKVNQGKRGITIHKASLTDCMQKYAEQLIEEVALPKGAGHAGRKIKVENELRKLAEILWEKNVRQLPYSPDYIQIFNDCVVADKLIDEGCCMIEMRDGEAYVQFSYDMIAGYFVAKYIVEIYPTKEELAQYITEHKSLFFGEKRHTFAQDVIKSLLCLAPKKYGIHLCILIPDSEVINATFENLDGLLLEPNGLAALKQLIDQSVGDSSMMDKLCECIVRRLTVERNLFGFSHFMPLFIQMKPIEIDQYWNSRFVEYPIMSGIRHLLHDTYYLQRFQWDDVINCNIMMCGIMDKEFHEIYHTQLFHHVLSHYDDISGIVFRNAINIKDAFVFESIVFTLTGIALRTDNKDRYDSVVNILETYMQSYTSNCVFLLDALDTLYSYGEYKWRITPNRAILSKNKSEKWEKVKYREIDLFGLYDYDFDKFNVRPLYSKSYAMDFTNKLLTEKAVYGMLLARSRRNGYDVDICAKLNNEAYERASYRTYRHVNYGHKYARFALLELYGWLILNGYINPAYKNTFRIETVDVDPSTPKFPVKRSLVNRSMMPKSIEDLNDWIDRDDTKLMEGLFIRRLPGYEGKWVLLQGRMTQQISDKYATYYTSGHVELADPSLTDKAISKMEVLDSIDASQMYVAEIGWRQMESREADYYPEEEKQLLAYYAFTSWSDSRFRYRNFEFLKTEISSRYGLRFDVNTMTYYDTNGIEASAYFVNDSDLFFYMRKDLVDAMLKDTKNCLRFHIYERRMISLEIPKERDVYPKKYMQRDRDVVYRLKE